MVCKKRVKKKISILVPFQSQEAWRLADWYWLRKFWKEYLPHAEIIVGKDHKSQKRWYRPTPLPFSKTAAVNNAFKKSTGDVILILGIWVIV